MRRSLMIMVAAAAAVACGTPAAYASTGAAHSAPAPAVSGTWGTAEVVPGTAALNTQGQAATTAVSCPSTGNCAVAGTYALNTAIKLVVRRERPEWEGHAGTAFTLALAKGVEPPAVIAWFYPGRTTGHEFVYPKQEEKELAMATQATQVSGD